MSDNVRATLAMFMGVVALIGGAVYGIDRIGGLAYVLTAVTSMPLIGIGLAMAGFWIASIGAAAVAGLTFWLLGVMNPKPPRAESDERT